MSATRTREAFTLIELVFVIVIIGILATVALPKLWVTRDDAIVSKGRADVATIRSAISTIRQKNLLEGNASYPSFLDTASIMTEDQPLFENILDYPIYSKNAEGKWMKTGTRQYTFRVLNNSVAFDYNNTTGRFDCDHTDEYCKILTH